MHGIQCSIGAQKELEKSGLKKTIDDFITGITDRREQNMPLVASVGFSFDELGYGFEISENWNKFNTSIENGEFSRVMNLPANLSAHGHRVTFGYLAMRAADRLWEDRRDSHVWTSGDYKTWTFNGDDEFLSVERMNLNFREPWTLINTREKRNCKDMCCHWDYWSHFLMILLKYAKQTGQEGIHEIKNFEEFLDPGDKKEYVPFCNDIRSGFKYKFEKPLPFIVKGELCPIEKSDCSLEMDSSNRPHRVLFTPYLTGNDFLYLTEENYSLRLNLGLMVHFSDMKRVEKELGGRPFFYEEYGGELHPVWQYMTFSPQELSHLLRATYKGYSRVKREIKPIVEYALGKKEVAEALV